MKKKQIAGHAWRNGTIIANIKKNEKGFWTVLEINNEYEEKR